MKYLVIFLSPIWLSVLCGILAVVGCVFGIAFAVWVTTKIIQEIHHELRS